MNIQVIPFQNLLICFVPVLLVIGLMKVWGLAYGKAMYAIGRMLLQLMLIGYALIMIFESDSSLITLLVLCIMMLASAWISLNTVKMNHDQSHSLSNKFQLFFVAVVAVLIGGGSILAMVTQLVLDLDPWYLPRYVIPLAGMIFATAMTSISLAGERLQSEMANGLVYDDAKKVAFNTSMIPNVNSLFAVGLVSLPGMMTGQILSGVSPFIAARYQIMVMCMLFAAAGLSAVIFLVGGRKILEAR